MESAIWMISKTCYYKFPYSLLSHNLWPCIKYIFIILWSLSKSMCSVPLTKISQEMETNSYFNTTLYVWKKSNNNSLSHLLLYKLTQERTQLVFCKRKTIILYSQGFVLPPFMWFLSGSGCKLLIRIRPILLPGCRSNIHSTGRGKQ